MEAYRRGFGLMVIICVGSQRQKNYQNRQSILIIWIDTKTNIVLPLPVPLGGTMDGTVRILLLFVPQIENIFLEKFRMAK